MLAIDLKTTPLSQSMSVSLHWEVWLWSCLMGILNVAHSVENIVYFVVSKDYGNDEALHLFGYILLWLAGNPTTWYLTPNPKATEVTAWTSGWC